MQDQNTLKTLHSDDINQHIHELPEIQAHIRDEIPKIQGDISDDDEYIRIGKKPVEEAYDRDTSQETQRIASYAVEGKDYDKELEAVHKNVPQYIPEGHTSNAYDNYIYDVLKRGKPNGETVAHIHDVIYGSSDVPEVENYGGMNRYHNQKYLADKWEPLLYHHAKKKQSVFDAKDATYTKEELDRIPQTFTPMGLRLLHHTDSGHVYEMHPTEGLNYISSKFASEYSTVPNTGHEQTDLSDKLHDHYRYDRSPAVTQYTVDSAPINRFHHLVHNGKLGNTQTIVGMSVDDIPGVSDKISEHFRTAVPPTHFQDFHVYTGLYGESNPMTQSTHKDEHGNLIFHNPSFTSTSTDENTAQEFAKTKADSSYGHRVSDVFKIRIPGGYPHGAFIRPISDHADENEFLLDKGHTFKVNPNPTHMVTNNKIVRVWDAELHHHDVNENVPFEQHHRNEKLDLLLHPDVKSETIERAAKDEDPAVRAFAAKHSRLQPETLKQLAVDESPRVRQASMLNPHVPHQLMQDTIADPANAVAIAQRKDLPAHVVDQLVNHDFESVNSEVAKRHDLSGEHIGQLIKTGGNSVMKSLAGNVSLHPDLLHEFRDHPDVEVRSALAGNTSIRHDTAAHLYEEPNVLVWKKAGKNPAMKKI